VWKSSSLHKGQLKQEKIHFLKHSEQEALKRQSNQQMYQKDPFQLELRICNPVHPAVYGSIVILVVSSVVVFLSVRSPKQDVGNVQMLSRKQSVAGVYKQGAVISDYEQCSKIGR